MVVIHLMMMKGEIYDRDDMLQRSISTINVGKLDVHVCLMRCYKEVPEWWFLILLAGSMEFSLLLSFVCRDEFQIPWWGMIMACALSCFLTLPIGFIQETTNQVLCLSFLTLTLLY